MLGHAEVEGGGRPARPWTAVAASSPGSDEWRPQRRQPGGQREPGGAVGEPTRAAPALARAAGDLRHVPREHDRRRRGRRARPAGRGGEPPRRGPCRGPHEGVLTARRPRCRSSGREPASSKLGAGVRRAAAGDGTRVRRGRRRDGRRGGRWPRAPAWAWPPGRPAAPHAREVPAARAGAAPPRAAGGAAARPSAPSRAAGRPRRRSRRERRRRHGGRSPQRRAPAHPGAPACRPRRPPRRPREGDHEGPRREQRAPTWQPAQPDAGRPPGRSLGSGWWTRRRPAVAGDEARVTSLRRAAVAGSRGARTADRAPLRDRGGAPYPGTKEALEGLHAAAPRTSGGAACSSGRRSGRRPWPSWGRGPAAC